MKRVLVTICLSLAAIWSVSAMADNFGVVNMQQIFRTSSQIKTINTKLRQQFSARKANIVKIGKDLQLEVQKFRKDQSVMDAKNLQALRSKISTQGLKLRQAQQKFQTDLQTAQAKQMREFISTVKKVVKEIATKRKLDIVLPSNTVLYSSSNLDITSSVLSALKR